MAAQVRECTAREFLVLSKNTRALGPERQFTPDRAACDPARNPLLGRRHAFLIAGDGVQPKARLLLMDGGETAWFSMPVLAEDEYSRALVDRAAQIARSWGAQELGGPVSPDGSGFGIGAPMPGSVAQSAPWHPERDDELTSALARCGLKARVHLLEMGLTIAGKADPYRGAERWAMERRGLRVEALGRGRRACEVAYAACDEEKARGYAAFERMFARCGELAPGMETLVAFCDGGPVGWMLLVKEKKELRSPPKRAMPSARELWKRIGMRDKGAQAALMMPAGYPAQKSTSGGRTMRILHMQILPGYRRGCCAAAMLDRAWREAENFGAQRMIVSTIDSKNMASLRMAGNAGAETLADYALFFRKIEPVSGI